MFKCWGKQQQESHDKTQCMWKRKKIGHVMIEQNRVWLVGGHDERIGRIKVEKRKGENKQRNQEMVSYSSKAEMKTTTLDQ